MAPTQSACVLQAVCCLALFLLTTMADRGEAKKYDVQDWTAHKRSMCIQPEEMKKQIRQQWRAADGVLDYLGLLLPCNRTNCWAEVWAYMAFDELRDTLKKSPEIWSGIQWVDEGVSSIRNWADDLF